MCVCLCVSKYLYVGREICMSVYMYACLYICTCLCICVLRKSIMKLDKHKVCDILAGVQESFPKKQKLGFEGGLPLFHSFVSFDQGAFGLSRTFLLEFESERARETERVRERERQREQKKESPPAYPSFCFSRSLAL